MLVLVGELVSLGAEAEAYYYKSVSYVSIQFLQIERLSL